MGSASGDLKHRVRLLLSDPWFWGLAIVVGVLVAAVNEWLAEPLATWAPAVVIAGGVLVFSVVRGQRYRS